MADDERFTDVTFLKMYPPNEVAEHEVFLAFDGDREAILFAEWWHHEGAISFQRYLKAVEEQGR